MQASYQLCPCVKTIVDLCPLTSVREVTVNQFYEIIIKTLCIKFDDEYFMF